MTCAPAVLILLGARALVVPPTANVVRTPARVVPRISLLADEPAPPEVIEAEDRATPNRKYRLAAAGVGVGISTISAGLAIATMTGDEAFISSDVLLFGNPILTLAVDVIIGGTSGWAWQQEQRIKRENIARIWEEVQRRRTGGGKPGSNRSQRRAKKVAVRDPVAGMGGFSSPPTPPASAKAPPSTPSPQPSSRILGGIEEFFNEANELGELRLSS